jgi:hypothetical protein
VKEGYTPFEESITIKPSEVFAYKVKPFAKHTVLVSEEGNTGETDKKATVRTGKLIIQSVPIEIKITMPDIEGMTNTAKTKDKWQADEIPAGNYKITFTYNQKVITKTIEVIGSETTSLFVNMLSGDFKTNNTLDEKNKKDKQEKQDMFIRTKEGDENFKQFNYTKYKIGIDKNEFIKAHPDLGLNSVKIKDQSGLYPELIDKNKDLILYVKNEKVCGYLAEISKGKFEQGSFESEKIEYSKNQESVDIMVNYFISQFNFSPTIETVGPQKYWDGKYNKRYSWIRNGKKVVLEIAYLKKTTMWSAFYQNVIFIYSFDENLAK